MGTDQDDWSRAGEGSQPPSVAGCHWLRQCCLAFRPQLSTLDSRLFPAPGPGKRTPRISSPAGRKKPPSGDTGCRSEFDRPSPIYLKRLALREKKRVIEPVMEQLRSPSDSEE